MKRSSALLLVLLSLHSLAQNTVPADRPDYPQGYFRNPLDIPIFLAGNFGECRPGHFHSGTDIKTLGKEGQPVHAAAEGYISRIKMEKGGFGHALYITHPNGYTTLYAHLSIFAPAIQQYMKAAQYKQQRWNVDLELPPAQFPVKKGQQIAWSGNTGSSTAPHLHFEIRNTKTEHPLNPELFGLPIFDNIPPKPAEVAVYDLGTSIYEQSPALYPLHKSGNGYTPKTDTLDGPAITGIGLNMDDYMNGSDNTIAPYTIKLYMDDALQAGIKLDDIGYDETRYINAYADYKTKFEHGQWIQCLFQLPGNHLDRIYHNLNAQKGGLMLSGTLPHKIKIEVTDDRDNVTVISFYIKEGRPNKPDAVEQTHVIHLAANKTNTINDPNVKCTLDEPELYDNVDFELKSTPVANAFSDKYTIAYPSAPVHHYYDLSIKPNTPVPFELRDKVAMLYSDGKDQEGTAATGTDQGWYKCTVRDLGTFWLVADTVAPVIRSLQANGSNLSMGKQITFEVNDALTSVKGFKGELDGKWICFEQHTNLFFYKFDEHCPKGKHTLAFTATDENGNTAAYHLTFTR